MGLHKINNTNLFMTKPNVLNKIRYHSKKSEFAAYIIKYKTVKKNYEDNKQSSG